MSLGDTLKRLPDDKRRILQYAFEHGIAQFVESEPGHFVGVNINQKQFPNLHTSDSVGVWSEGKIAKGI